MSARTFINRLKRLERQELRLAVKCTTADRSSYHVTRRDLILDAIRMAESTFRRAEK